MVGRKACGACTMLQERNAGSGSTAYAYIIDIKIRGILVQRQNQSLMDLLFMFNREAGGPKG